MPNSPITEQKLRSCTLLIVEDEPTSRKLLEHALRGYGFENIFVAANGSQGLELTKAHLPDLVILDIMMPTMDGFAYCRAVRAEARFAQMPILVQTALDAVENKLEAFKLGATDYICKPLDVSELIARVRVHLMQRLMLEELSNYREQMQHEMEAARAMQSRIMPSPSQISICERVFNMHIGYHFEPSSALGGDFWGVRPLSDKRLALYVMDFSGHGVSAAMNVFRIHTVMQECAHAAGDPAIFLTILNQHLYPLLQRDEFATMFYGIIDTEANCLLYATAAMHSVPLFSPHAMPLMLDGRGFALGAVKNATYETKFAPFMKGDMLMLYSDCVIETPNAIGMCLSEPEIADMASRIDVKQANPAQATVDTIVDLLRAHTSTPLVDDLTICAFKRN